MRVLIVYENRHRSYGEALEGAVRGLRPGLEVLLVQARELAGEVGRFDPHLVVSGRSNTVDPGGRAAWMTLSEEPEEPSEVCVGGRRRGMENPGLEELLAILDETEKSVLTGGEELVGC
jgi:hypothetical protein